MSVRERNRQAWSRAARRRCCKHLHPHEQAGRLNSAEECGVLFVHQGIVMVRKTPEKHVVSWQIYQSIRLQRTSGLNLPRMRLHPEAVKMLVRNFGSYKNAVHLKSAHYADDNGLGRIETKKYTHVLKAKSACIGANACNPYMEETLL